MSEMAYADPFERQPADRPKLTALPDEAKQFAGRQVMREETESEESLYFPDELSPLGEMTHYYAQHSVVLASQQALIGPLRSPLDINDDPLHDYLTHSSRIKLLTKEDEAVLSERVQKGLVAWQQLSALPPEKRSERAELERAAIDGVCATWHFYLSNTRLVVTIAKKYKTPSLSMRDVVDFGNQGLFVAIEKFDHRKGFRFSTYASWWMRQKITNGIIREQNLVLVPKHSEDKLIQLRRARWVLEEAGVSAPTIKQLSAEMMRPIAEVRELLGYENLTLPMSLDERYGEHQDVALNEAVSDPSCQVPFSKVEELTKEQRIEEWRSVLTKTECDILYGHFFEGEEGKPKSLGLVAEELDMALEKVVSMKSRALMKLARQDLMPKLYERCGLDAKAVRDFRAYFFAQSPPVQQRDVTKTDLGFIKRVRSILVDSFDPAVMEAVIAKIVQREKAKGSPTKGTVSAEKLEERLKKRFGLQPLGKGDWGITFVRRCEEQSTYHRFETEVLWALIYSEA